MKQLRIRKGRLGFVLLMAVMLTLTGCETRRVWTIVTPVTPKQGDMVTIRVTATDKSHLSNVQLTVNGVLTERATVPFDVPVSLCRTITQYPTTLHIVARAVYDDGEVVRHEVSFDLTVSDPTEREDADHEFALYVADNPPRFEDLEVEMANAVRTSFDTFHESQYYWSEKRFYAEQALQFANGSDFIFSYGHGRPHIFCYHRANDLDLSETEYGSFVPCHETGDAEHLAFFACDVLSMKDVDGTPFWDFWFPPADPPSLARPFYGLHHVMGFRTNFAVRSYLWGSWHVIDGDDCNRQFVNKLDQGWTIRAAWLDAASDELRQRNGDNMAAVLYPYIYAAETLTPEGMDYIVGNSNIQVLQISYLEKD